MRRVSVTVTTNDCCDGSPEGAGFCRRVGSNRRVRLGHSSIQVTMNRYGHLMEGLDDRTADRLDAIAESWSGPGAAQTQNDETETQRANPLTSGDRSQSRAGSNRRFRLERPAS